jgi:hypothetical protein
MVVVPLELMSKMLCLADLSCVSLVGLWHFGHHPDNTRHSKNNQKNIINTRDTINDDSLPISAENG